MNWKIKPEALKPKPSIPPVGHFWRHTVDPTFIYLRIADEVGNTIFGFPPNRVAEKFFSVDKSGRIVHTSIYADDIEILSPSQIDFSECNP